MPSAPVDDCVALPLLEERARDRQPVRHQHINQFSPFPVPCSPSKYAYDFFLPWLKNTDVRIDIARNAQHRLTVAQTGQPLHLFSESLLLCLRPTRLGSEDAGDMYTICWRIIIHTAMILPCHLSTRTISLLISTFTMLPTPLLLPSRATSFIPQPSSVPCLLSTSSHVGLHTLLPSSVSSSFPLLPTPFPPSSPRSDVPSGLRIRVVGGWTFSLVLVHVSPLSGF